jgi:Flp pilus assembly protein TadD
VETHEHFGKTLAGLGRLDEAVGEYQRTLKIKPDHAAAHADLGSVLLRRGQVAEALAHFRKAVEISPDAATPHNNLGVVLAGQGGFAEALIHFRRATEIQPDHTEAHKNLAWLRATCPQASLRNGAEAIEHGRRADQLCGGKRADILDCLAAAYAEGGRFPEALATARNALELATRQNAPAFADILRTRIALYAAGKPFHQASPPSTPLPPRP